MLVLSRKEEQSIIIGENIEIKILSIRGDTVKIGISAPPELKIYRKEVLEEIQRANINAVQSSKNLKDIILGKVKEAIEKNQTTDK
ncbi:MAG: carbon storage regulator CsrA [Spirochaetia bacterium]|nr:carbon storage regulator CsrA [Spirochaetota bacterium]MCX8096406.1 carbon storage regulator CsrA [Spirochaetota bacterium]MDW8112713.1 carbon storage regulator CsrA [Spirochaetia bacterium]